MSKKSLIIILIGVANIAAYFFLTDRCGVPIGNITMNSWYQFVNRQNQELREFKHEPNLFKGIYSGIIKAEGLKENYGKSVVITDMEYYHFQFKGCLQGNERLLDIFIPVILYEETSYNPNGRVEETENELKKGKPAFLYIGELHKFLDKENIKDYFGKTYNISLNSWEDYPVLLEAMTPIWYPAYLGGNSIYLNYPFELKGRFYAISPVKLKLKWIIRNPFSKIYRPIIGFASMVITIPLDIITSPVQIVLWTKSMTH